MPPTTVGGVHVRAIARTIFEPGWADHWVTEWWDGRRWRRTDAQIDQVQRDAWRLEVDTADLAPDAFWDGGTAWLAVRAGAADASRFGFGDLRGEFMVQGNVVRDLAALNKVEVLPWDCWGWMEAPPAPAAWDELAAVTTRGTLDDRRGWFRREGLYPDEIISRGPGADRRDRLLDAGGQSQEQAGR